MVLSIDSFRVNFMSLHKIFTTRRQLSHSLVGVTHDCMLINKDFRFLESTVPYVVFIGEYNFSLTDFPVFIYRHISKVYFYKTIEILTKKQLLLYLIDKILKIMLIVDVNPNESIDKALKKLKSKVIKTRQVQILNNRKEYVKKSVRRRSTKQKAIYTQKIKNLQ